MIFGFLLPTLAALLAAATPTIGRAASLLPLQTEAAQTLAAGHAEVVLGASYFRNRRFPPFTPGDELQSQHLVTAPELGLRVAAGSWVEIQAAFEMIYLSETMENGDHNSQFGNGDARLFTKVRLFSEHTYRPAIGLRFGAKVPNANKNDRLGTDETDFGIDALLTKQIGPVTTHLNLGLLLLGNPGFRGESADGQDDLLAYSVAAVSPAFGSASEGAWAARVLAEFAGLAGSRFDNDRAVGRMGVHISRGDLVLYAGTSVGLVTASEDYGFSGGIIYAFDLARLLGGEAEPSQ